MSKPLVTKVTHWDCLDCGREFFSREVLKEHVREWAAAHALAMEKKDRQNIINAFFSEYTVRVYRCCRCTQVFEAEVDATAHYLRKHNG